MKRLAILTAALGAVVMFAGVAAAQEPTTPAPQAPTTVGPAFVDADHDGVCDNCTGTPQRKGQNARRSKGGFGPGKGSGHQGVGPRDGSGYGRKGGVCNGTGPRGRGRR